MVLSDLDNVYFRIKLNMMGRNGAQNACWSVPRPQHQERLAGRCSCPPGSGEEAGRADPETAARLMGSRARGQPSD